MTNLRRAWYILLYHDVSWEDSTAMRHIGGACPPDIFERQVRASSELARLVDIEEGWRRLATGAIDEPMVSFWFDDGTRGVRELAAPILMQFGVRGATSICSRFVMRTELFWRSMLSRLRSVGETDKLRHLVPGLADGTDLSGRSIARFDESTFAIIAELHDRVFPERDRKEALRLFDDIDGARALRDSGWTVTNHTAAHYPFLPDTPISALLRYFEECDAFLAEALDIQDAYWVVPFGRITPGQIQELRSHKGDALKLVLTGNTANTPTNFANSGVIRRIGAPSSGGGRDIEATLARASRAIH